MNKLRVSSVAQMREMDQRVINDLGIPELILMENAALAMLHVLVRVVPIAESNFVVLCGSGNNGGDGMALARLLASRGGNVDLVLVAGEERLAGSTRKNYDLLSSFGITPMSLEECYRLLPDLRHEDVVIDALLGTGISRNVTGEYATAIGHVNRCSARVLSVDIPSGINGDTGQVMGSAIKASWTVTFGAPKLGNLLYPGFARCGRLFCSPISFPMSLHEGEQMQVEINSPLALPPRAADGHKGTFGDALFVAGAGSYYGAPFLAAYALMKAGGGYSRLATPKSIAPVVAQMAPELVFVPQEETNTGAIALSNLDSLVSLSRRVDFVVLGPGLSLDDEVQELARKLATRIEGPLLIDGDGITAVHNDLNVVRERKGVTILTPHMGEMARITGRTVSEIEADRIDVLRQTATDLNAIIVLKGAHSLIGYPTGRIYVNLSGNSGMATAGSGDVLTGIIAAMAGLGLDVNDAVRQGVFVHGVAGDLAAADLGEDGVTAREILNHLPIALSKLRMGDYHGAASPYAIPMT